MAAPVEDPNKEAFLARVRGALGRTEPITSVPDHPPLKATLPRHEEKVRTILGKVEARRSLAVTMLADNASKASWNVHRVKGDSEAAAAVGEIARKIGARNLIRTTEDIFKRVDVDGVLRKRGVSPTVLASGRSRRRSDLKPIAFRSDLGISGVEYAIAETASCAIVPRRGVARMTTLAPPVIALIIDESQVLESLDDFFALVRFQFLTSRAKSPNYYNFISGPSRTADIEQTLTIGVHGPGEVHMVLVESQR
jgi:L-lactate dehydrogenase complex protein LldG